MPPWPSTPPPGPFRPRFWKSPLRGPWLTSLFGALLLVAIPVIVITGFLSNAAYNPQLGGNSVGRTLGPLDFYLFSWPTRPVWLYAATQGTHVTLGLATIPILLSKLWSVIPRLFEWPPVRSPAHALERLSLALLVGGALFEFATGVLNIQDDYAFGFFFTDAHYYGAWVFTAAFVFHAAIKLPTMRSSLRTRRVMTTLREDLAHTQPESAQPEAGSLIAVQPAAATTSRRALIGTAIAGSLLLALQGFGQSVGGSLRGLAFLAPRDRDPGSGPNGFQINQTFEAVGLDPSQVDHTWRLELVGRHKVSLSRLQLLAMPQRSYDLPIACVEGWSTTQRWTGVRIRDLARLAGFSGPSEMTTCSLEQNGLYSEVTWSVAETADDEALLALRVNGADLSLDHGYPARVIAPAIPGVHCTKWIAMLTFAQA